MSNSTVPEDVAAWFQGLAQAFKDEGHTDQEDMALDIAGRAEQKSIADVIVNYAKDHPLGIHKIEFPVKVVQHLEDGTNVINHYTIGPDAGPIGQAILLGIGATAFFSLASKR